MCSRFNNPCIPQLEPPTTEGYEMQITSESDREELLAFLYKSYIPDEPLNKSLNVKETDDFRDGDVDDFYTNLFGYNVSLKVVTTTGEIVAVCLNKMVYKLESEKLKSANPKMQKIASLLNEVTEKADVFGKHTAEEKFLAIQIMAVDAAWRKRGIAGELLTHIKYVATENGCNVVTMNCTNEYAAQAARARGFECLYELKYENYKENDEVVFQPPKPHEAVTVFSMTF